MSSVRPNLIIINYNISFKLQSYIYKFINKNNIILITSANKYN